jgi:hypothetical protein
MEDSQYCHFPIRAQEGAQAMVMSAGDSDLTGFFADQVKLTRAMVQNLDKAVKEVKLLGEHGEESCQKITKLEALCKRLREDAQKLKEENTKLEGLVESRDELTTEIAKELGLDYMGEDAKAADEDDDNGGDTTTPHVVVVPFPAPTPPAAAAPEKIIVEEDHVEMVPEQEASVAHEVILVNAEPEMS